MSVALWQHPFVDVFKHVGAVRMEILSRGDVEQLMDKHIRKTVYQLRGKIAASNFLRIPKDMHTIPSLHLTGRFVYVELRQMQGDSITFHLDIVTKKKTMLRLTFSSMYSSTRSMGINLRVPLTLTNKWTVLALDMFQLLDLHTSVSYNREGYEALKAVLLCSSMYVRGIYTSNILYLPETLPRAMQFPVVKSIDENGSASWNAAYDWHWLPQSPKEPNTPISAFLRFDNPSNNQRDIRADDAVRPPSLALEIPEPSPSSSPPRTKSPSPPPAARQIIQDDGESQLHATRLRVLHQADAILKKAGIQPTSVPPRAYKHTTYSRPAKSPTILSSPVLTLDRVVGFSSASRDSVVYGASSSIFYYACESTLVVGKLIDNGGVTTLEQELLLGHTDVITAIAFSPSTGLVASAQSGSTPCIRLWRSGLCTAMVQAHALGVHTVALSPDGSRMCGVGCDAKRRTQLVVWDVSASPPVVVAKQLCDYAIAKIKFAPHEDDRLVSCGRESIRFWRVKAGHLPGCPVVLHEYARDHIFTDVDFDPVAAHHVSRAGDRPVYVSSSHGTVLVIGYDSMLLTCVYKLHDGPIRCLRVNEGFCVTGADDGYVRVWPLDFSDFYIEAQHDASVQSIDLSLDGLHALIGCVNGTIGVLDLTSQQYKTVVRVHTQAITAISLSPRGDAAVSTATDGTIRVWDVSTGIQTYEFKTADSIPTAIAFHERADGTQLLAVGFASGVLRIVDMQSMQILETYQQHGGAVVDVQYGRTACYSTGVDQQLCCYQAQATTVHMIHCGFPPDKGCFCLDLGLKLLALPGKDSRSIELRDMYSLRLLRAVYHKDHQKHHQRLKLVGFVQAQLVAMDAVHRVLFCCPTTGNILKMYPPLTSGPASAVVFTPMGRFAMAGRMDESMLHVVRLETSQQLRATQVFPGHSTPIQLMEMSSDGKTLMTCGATSALCFWKYQGPLETTDDNNDLSVVVEDDSALYDLQHQALDTDEDEPNTEIPTPIEPPTKHRDVMPTSKPLTWQVGHTVGWNTSARSPVVWSAPFNMFLSATGTNLVLESPDQVQERQQLHTSDIRGLALSPDESVVASFDLDIVCVSKLSPWLSMAQFQWPRGTTAAFVSFGRASGRHLLVGAATTCQSTTFLVWDFQGNSLVAQATILSTKTTHVAWFYPSNEDDESGTDDSGLAFCSTAPLQGWRIDADAGVLVPIDLLDACPAAIGATSVHTSAGMSSHVLYYDATNRTLAFIDHSNRAIAAITAFHKRHVVSHLEWLRDFVVVATQGASCIWIYSIDVDTCTLHVHTSTTADELEIHALRVNDAIVDMTWHHDSGSGLVHTTGGALWYIEAASHSKQLVRHVHTTSIAAVAATVEVVVTIANHSVQLWDASNLREVASHDATIPVSCVDVNGTGCVVGYADGSFQVFDVVLSLVHSGEASSWQFVDHVIDSSQSSDSLPRPMHFVKFVGDSASFLLASAFGDCAIFHIPTRRLQHIALPFGRQKMAPSPLSSQVPSIVDGTCLGLVTCRGHTTTWAAVWQSTQSSKCYVNVFANVSTAQDAWEMVETPRRNACAVVSPEVATIMVYPSHGDLEGRCFEQREVMFRIVVDTIPQAMALHGSYVLCHASDSLCLLDLAHDRVHQTAQGTLQPHAHVCATSKAVYAVEENRLSIIEMHAVRRESTA
ncbi:unnamed protein product [Aphanomyces euteiches]